MATTRAKKKTTAKRSSRTIAKKTAPSTAKDATRPAAPARRRGPRVGWWEIMVKDKAASDSVKKFFTKVFGWKISSDPQFDYGQVSDKDAGIGGGIGPSRAGTNAVTFYIEVDDPTAYLKKIQAAGGRTVMPETNMGTVSFAQFTDPAGNVVGLYKGTGAAG